MWLDESVLRGMIEFTLLHNTDTADEVREFARKAREGGFATAYVMPCFSGLVARELAGSATKTGGAVAFPTGAEPMEIKEAMTRHHISVGAGEIDYVINLNQLKSGDYGYLAEEARRILAAAQGRPVKAIIEVTLLTEEEIRRASRCLMERHLCQLSFGRSGEVYPQSGK